MITSGTDQDIVSINIDTLWTGGPFEDPVRETLCLLTRLDTSLGL